MVFFLMFQDRVLEQMIGIDGKMTHCVTIIGLAFDAVVGLLLSR